MLIQPDQILQKQQGCYMLSAIPTRWRLTFTPLSPLMLPEFSGSLLRGVFGHALKDMACACSGDRHESGCRYQHIFESPLALGNPTQGVHTPPPAYVLTPPALGARRVAIGEPVSFELTLLGPAIAEEGLILAAWRRALRRGLGHPAVPCELLQAQPVPLPIPAADTQAVRLNLTTPWHIKRYGKPLAANACTPGDILQAMTHRIQVVRQTWNWPCAPQTPEPDALQAGAHIRMQLQDAHWERFSNRQRRCMPLSGVLGHMDLHARQPHALNDWLPLLNWITWLHGGGKAALGLGGLRLDPIPNHSQTPVFHDSTQGALV